MKHEIADLWIERLKSGKYQQHKGCLKSKKKDGTNGHCCLGVLCEIYQETIGDLVEGTDEDSSVTFQYDGKWNYLPKKVTDWAGMKSSAGDYGNMSCLSYDNDHGQTFEQIADTIEKRKDEL